MAESTDSSEPHVRRSLNTALRLVKNRQADRDDVVIEMKEAERTRLELLAEELRPIFEDLDPADERFEFALSNGERPRLWIDMTSFVGMGNDRRTYQFVKNTRLGREYLAESSNMQHVADEVSNYVAEKVIERERQIEGDWIALRRHEPVETAERPAPKEQPEKPATRPEPAAVAQKPRPPAAAAAPATSMANAASPAGSLLTKILAGFAIFVLGMISVFAIFAAIIWFFPDRF